MVLRRARGDHLGLVDRGAVGEVYPLALNPQLLRSAVISVPHAFTTRRGGVSSGDFASLNFGNPAELPREQRDPPGNIRANFSLVLDAIGCAGREVVEVHQVHGREVHIVRAGSPAHPTPHDTRADAIITNDPSRVLAIRVADCASVLLSTPDGRIVGAAHAGWRGVIAGVVPEAVRAMRGLGATRIVGAVGPCISVEHFEIGPEVAAEFRRVFGAGTLTIRERGNARPMADLKLAIRLQLEAAGVADIDVLSHCTHADRDLFFSHRRDQIRSGRMVGVIGPNNPRA